ncbi:MAG TPA: DUF3662 and FHA domain-containing protein [Actinomycetota bacterium]|nr:DUF3662 and FHA domain-containing protein [Actinomycetota bacterium]
MGVARSIEDRLEGLVEGFFTKVFRSGLQPVEVGRKILKEMAEGKTVSVNRVYAPNEFAVTMGADDYSRFSQMASGLKKEFAELVIEQAKQNRWNLMGLPEIEFVQEEGMGRGEFKVSASLKAGEVPQPATRSEKGSDSAPSTGSRASLLIIGREGKSSQTVPLTSSPVVIGRMSGCDIVLDDANASRRHAELRHHDGTWTVVDLGSTNGTNVNDRRVKEHDLEEADRLTIGSTNVIFREGED